MTGIGLLNELELILQQGRGIASLPGMPTTDKRVQKGTSPKAISSEVVRNDSKTHGHSVEGKQLVTGSWNEWKTIQNRSSIDKDERKAR